MLIITKKLDISPRSVPHSTPQVINVSQYDSDFEIQFKLYASTGTFTIEEGTTAAIKGTKPSGTGYSADASIDIETKTVTVSGDVQMTAVAGRCIYEIALYKDNKEINSANFILLVERAALDADTITDESVLRNLEAIVEGAETATQAADDAVDAKTAAEAAQQAAEAAAEQAEGAIEVDDTLSIKGRAADALKTGIEINAVKNVLETAFSDATMKRATLPLSGGIDASGNATTTGHIKHSKLIPVKYGKTYRARFTNGAANFNFRIHGVNENAVDDSYSKDTWIKQLGAIAPTTINAVNEIYFTVDNSSIKYVILTGNYLYYGDYIELYGDFLECSVSDQILQSVAESHVNTSLWMVGGYDGQTPNQHTNRLRSIDYFTSKEYYSIHTKTGYETLINAWDKSTGEWIGMWGNNGTEFVKTGTTTYVTDFDFTKFPDYKFKVLLRNANDISATMTVEEAVNAVFLQSKFASTDSEVHFHAGYFRQYSDITSELVWQNKTISEEGIEDSSTEAIAQLPSSGNVEIRLRRTTEDNQFSVYQKVGSTITKLCDWTHYEYRYTGDYTPEYYVRTKTDSSSNRDFLLKHCVVVYKYCDQGMDHSKSAKLFGKKVAVFGDSIVQGKVRKNSATTVNSVTCKPWSSLIAEVNGDFNPHNFGIGGATVANAGTSLYPDWKSLYTLRDVVEDFDVVFVCAGVNDYGANISESDFRSAYSDVLDALIENNTEVVVVTLCARSSNSANSAGLKPSDYADIEKEIGTDKDLKIIDLYTLTDNAEYKDQLPDGLHPNEIGHQIIANLILSGY